MMRFLCEFKIWDLPPWGMSQLNRNLIHNIAWLPGEGCIIVIIDMSCLNDIFGVSWYHYMDDEVFDEDGGYNI